MTGGGLLPGGAVAGLEGHHQGAQAGALGIKAGQGLLNLGIGRILPAQQLHCLYRLGPGDVLGVLPAQGEVGQPQGVGAVGGGLPRGDELVGGGHRVIDGGAHREQQVLRQGDLLRPVGDVGAEDQLLVRVGFAHAVVHPGLVGGVVIGPLLVWMVGGHVGQLVGGGEHAPHLRRCGDGPGVHQGHIGHLAIPRLGALPVGEVPGGVADGEAAVGGHVSRPEAGSAEAGADGRPGGHEGRDVTLLGQLQHDGHGAGVAGQPEGVGAYLGVPDDLGGPAQVLVGAAGAAGDHRLVHPELAVHDLVREGGGGLDAQLLPGVRLHLVEQVGHVLFEYPDGIGVGGVEGQGDHGLHLVQLHHDGPVVPGPLAGRQLAVAVSPAKEGKGGFGLLVRLPDGGQAGGLSGHHVDARPVVHGQAGHAGTEEFHDGVLHRAGFEGGPHQGQGHVLGAYPGPGSPGEVDGHHRRIGDVVGLPEQLPGQFRAALTDGHTAVGAVPGVGVGAQNHGTGGGVPLPHVGVDDCLMGGDELAAVALGRRQAEHVVILVDGASHGAQGVVAVGEHIGQRELLHPRGPGGLDDAHVGDVVGRHGVKPDGQPVRAAGGIVGLEDGPGHGGAHAALVLCGGDQAAALPFHSLVVNGQHEDSSCGSVKFNDLL